MSEEYEEWETIPGQIGTGLIGFGDAPYKLDDETASDELERRLERERRRLPGVGFLSPDLPMPKKAPRRRRPKR